MRGAWKQSITVASRTFVLTQQVAELQVKLVSLGDVQAKVSFRGDIASRPKWAARMLSWGLDLADFEGVPIRLTGFEVQDATMLWSRFIG